MRRRRRRRRARKRSGRGDRTGKITDVRVERSPNSRRKPAKVTRIRRRNGETTEETYEL